jgi:3-oxoacyl-[acyl-carrier-protein] synthase-3
MLMKLFPFRLVGVSSRIGRVLPIEDWARLVNIPHRFKPGERLTGEDIANILGIHAKSWDPDLFRDCDILRATAWDALKTAALPPSAIDMAMVVTCTPYEIMLDQDAFRLYRRLGLRDDVIPMQLCAGCAGLARASSIAASSTARRVLVVAYNVPSLFMMLDEHTPNPAYIENRRHPSAATLWASPALFSDGMAAMVLERCETDLGRCCYSRDSLSFGSGPPFENPLVTFAAGGAQHPPGSEGFNELACYAMAGDEIKKYYVEGMLLNHGELTRERPHYAREVKRLYVHQSSPALVNAFVSKAGLDAQKVAVKVAEYGNMVSPSTLRLLDEDIAAGRVGNGDEISVSVVGAGPERGAYLLKVEIRERMPTR